MTNKPMEEAVPLFICQSQMTGEQVKRIELETKDQHTSDLWRQQRVGRITASNFHHVHTKAESLGSTGGRTRRKILGTAQWCLTCSMNQRIRAIHTEIQINRFIKRVTFL